MQKNTNMGLHMVDPNQKYITCTVNACESCKCGIIQSGGIVVGQMWAIVDTIVIIVLLEKTELTIETTISLFRWHQHIKCLFLNQSKTKTEDKVVNILLTVNLCSVAVDIKSHNKLLCWTCVQLSLQETFEKHQECLKMQREAVKYRLKKLAARQSEIAVSCWTFVTTCYLSLLWYYIWK